MFTFELRRNVSDADFLLFLGDLVDEKYEIAGLYLSGQRDQRSSGVYDDRGSVLTERRQGNRRVAGVHNNRGNVLMESARRLAPSADQHGHMQRLALACASTPCLRRRRRGLRSRLVANCGILLGCFDGEFALGAVQLAFKVPRREENLLEGFAAVVEDDPAFVVTIRAAQPDSVVLRHGCPRNWVQYYMVRGRMPSRIVARVSVYSMRGVYGDKGRSLLSGVKFFSRKKLLFATDIAASPGPGLKPVSHVRVCRGA